MQGDIEGQTVRLIPMELQQLGGLRSPMLGSEHKHKSGKLEPAKYS